jgi:hypothetical protein
VKTLHYIGKGTTEQGAKEKPMKTSIKIKEGGVGG